MELSAYALAWIAGALGIVGTLAGTLCTYWLSLRIADRQLAHMKSVAKIDAWHVAARSFIEAFADDLEKLRNPYTIEERDIVDFLLVSYSTRQRNALAIFSHYLSPESRIEFNSDWQRYCYGSSEDGAPANPDDWGMNKQEALFLHCYPSASSGSATDPYGYTAGLIEKLLTYANRQP